MAGCIRGDILLKRIATGVVGVPLILLCLLTVRPLMIAMVAFLIIFSQLELSAMHRHYNHQPILVLPMVGSGLFWGFYLWGNPHWAGLTVMIYLCLLAFWAIAFFPSVTVPHLGYATFMLLYGAWTFMQALRLYDYPNGPFYLVTIFVAVWACDSGAYFTGYFLGKHKMAPLLSPKKTIEGAIGGVVSTVVAIFILNHFFALFSHLAMAFFFAVATAILGIIGDLFESYLKRMHEIKDSGHILPGHGGILDRFDSFMFVVPLFSVLLEMMHH